MASKQKIIGVIIALGLALMAIFAHGLYNNPAKQTTPAQSQNSDKATIVSTLPTALDHSTLLPTQTIEITFSDPIDEQYKKFDLTIEPMIDYKRELSADKKTIKIIPNKPFALGQGYSIKIAGDNKFQGNKTLDGDKSFQFTTISYNGV